MISVIHLQRSYITRIPSYAVVALNDNTQLFMSFLQKNESREKKGTLCHQDRNVQLPHFSARCGEFKSTGIMLFIAIWAVLLVPPQTLDATITDTFFRTTKKQKY